MVNPVPVSIGNQSLVISSFLTSLSTRLSRFSRLLIQPPPCVKKVLPFLTKITDKDPKLLGVESPVNLRQFLFKPNSLSIPFEKWIRTIQKKIFYSNFSPFLISFHDLLILNILIIYYPSTNSY